MYAVACLFVIQGHAHRFFFFDICGIVHPPLKARLSVKSSTASFVVFEGGHSAKATGSVEREELDSSRR